MKCIITTFFILFFCTPVFANNDLVCNGNEFSVYMGVGVDQKGNGNVGYASITDMKTKKNIEFYSSHIKTIKLMWLDGEEDFSSNILNVKLLDKTGETAKITAKGTDGKLYYKSETYKIDCNWEM